MAASYDENGNLTIVTDPQGRQQVYEYSQHGELSQSHYAQWCAMAIPL
nr:RHS repeat protein [Proteus mirabilis]